MVPPKSQLFLVSWPVHSSSTLVTSATKLHSNKAKQSATKTVAGLDKATFVGGSMCSTPLEVPDKHVNCWKVTDIAYYSDLRLHSANRKFNDRFSCISSAVDATCTNAYGVDARQYVWNWPGVAVSHLDAAY